jgi:molecular chaperone HtpG
MANDRDMNQTIAFQAEIKQLLNILVHSLYTEREIFLRELISNASDALTQMHFIMLTDRQVKDPDVELAIKINVDEDKKIITIRDTGIGMNREDLIENLGTIAHSGVRAFLDKVDVESGDLSDIIGQFGVGFYSVFMVAESVKVTSRSYRPDDQAASWTASGSDTYSISDAEMNARGTTIEIKLKEDAEDYAQISRLREIIMRHSDFVPFPIYLGDDEEQINRQTAVWRNPPRDVDDKEYEEFYKHLTMDFDPPLGHIHFVADAPLRVYALLFLPSNPERNIFSPRQEDGLKLYARKVLIQEYAKELLPQYYRFIDGVVDSEDLPLNISRESVQSTAIISRIRKILTNQVNNKLKEVAEKEPELYEDFWLSFGQYIKEGVASVQSQSEREGLYPLLRFRSTKFQEQWNSLNDYVGRMKLGQKKIYYILGDDPAAVKYSPHLDYFKKHSYEVLILTDPMDSFMLLGLREYEGFELINVASSDLKMPEADEEPDLEDLEEYKEGEIEELVERFKTQLGDRVSDVRLTERLSDSAARLVDPEGSLGQEMQRVYRMMDRDFEVPRKVLELNPKHPILVRMKDLAEEGRLNKIVIEQIYENALLLEGLHPDPAGMISRLQELMELLLEK